MVSRNVLSFSEKKVSRNAVITLIMGIAELAIFIILLLASIFTQGDVGMIGGYLGCLLMFGVLWGVLSYDDVKTNQRFKISGICLNVIVIFMGITFIML